MTDFHHIHHRHQGEQVNPTEHTAKTPSPRTGPSAMLRGLLGNQGSGAPSRRLVFVPLALVALVGALLGLARYPDSAQAAEPIHPLIGPFGTAAQPTFGQPGGMAVDPSTGDLYVIDAPVPA
jgi:hypothetical protein